MSATFDSFPFEAGTGSALTEQRWGYLFPWMRTTGILSTSVPLETDGDLAVNPASSPIGTQIQIENGEGFVEGYYFRQDDGPEIINIETNLSGDPRIDLVTLELDLVTNNIQYAVEVGTPDASPVAPDPIQTSTIWQLPLATVDVAASATEILPGDITDLRVRSVQGDSGSSAVTLGSAGAGESLVAVGTGPNLESKGLVGVGIGITSDASTVTLTAEGAPTDTPICVLRRNASLTVNNSSTPVISWTTAVSDPYSMWNGTTGIVIPSDGWYQITVNMTWTGNVSANGSLLCYTTKVGTRLAENRVMIVGDEDVSNNICTIANLSTSDVVTVVVTNNSGVNLDIPTGGSYTPVFSLWKVRS